MANSGFVSCGMAQWKAACPNGLSVYVEYVTDPSGVPEGDDGGETTAYHACRLPAVFDSYAGPTDGPPPTMAWDDANQILQSDSGPPYLTVFCDNGAWYVKFVNQTEPNLDLGSPIPITPQPENTWVFEAVNPNDPKCRFRFTFACA